MASLPHNWHDSVFFGVHYDLHTGADEKVLGAELTHEHLRAQLEQAGVDWVQCDCKGVPGYASYPTRVGTASPMVKDALRIHRDVTREMGIPLVVHYCSIMNTLEFERHRDWRRVGPDGKDVAGLLCITSPYATELMIPQMLEIVEEYDVDGFWVDADVWTFAPCYCTRCKAMFADANPGSEAPTSSSDPSWSAWQNFHREAYGRHLRAYTDAVHEKDPDCLVCCNWSYSLLQPEPIDAPLDYLSGDIPHAFTTEWSVVEARFLDNRGPSWDLMTWSFVVPPASTRGADAPPLKPVAQLCQEAAITVTSGGAVGLYVKPQRTGHLTSWVHDVLGAVSAFCKERKDVSHGTSSIPQVAVLHSLSHQRARQQLGASLQGGLYTGGDAVDAVKGATLALLDNHLHVDVLTEEQLLERIGSYALVVVPEQTALPAEVLDALRRYVEAGGRLLMTGAHVAAAAGELAGVQPAGDAIREHRYVPVDGRTAGIPGPWQPVTATTADALIELMDEQEVGKDEIGVPAMTRNQVGSGIVAVVHGPVFDSYFKSHHHLTRRLVGRLVEALEPDLDVHLDGPPIVHVSLRQKNGRLIVHLVNLGAEYPTSPRNAEIERVPPAGPLALRVRGARPTTVDTVPTLDGCRWDWADGWTTVEIPSLGIHAAVVFAS